MARRSLVALCALVLSAGLAIPFADAADPPGLGDEESSWIVVLSPGSDAPVAAAEVVSRFGGAVGHVYENVLQGFELRGTRATAGALRRNPNVVSVTPNGILEAAELLPFTVKRIDGWTAHQAGYDGRQGDGTPVRVAILDTGINPTHVDLAPNIITSEGKNCISGGPPTDDQGHGTHVAGSAAAAYNGEGMVGVATDAALVAVKVLDSQGFGSDAEVICGLDHVYALAGDGVPTIVNMSLGEARTETGGCTSSALHQAICNLHAAGVVVVTASGNGAVNVSGFQPAGFAETIAVSAFSDLDGTQADTGCNLYADILNSCDETLANFTNYGQGIDVAAPGVQVLSTSINGGHEVKSGTSMAAPHVAGVVALMLGANPSLTPEQIRAVLRETGECPDGTISGAATCTGSGVWLMSGVFGGASPELDGIPEPLVNALRAADAAAGLPLDLLNPSVTLTEPADGSTITGSVVVSADAADDVAVASVEFFVDGVSIGVDSTEPYSLVWDSAVFADGPRTLSAEAFDTSDNTATDSVDVTIDNPPDLLNPSVTLTEPADGSTITGSVVVSADAADDVAVASVEFFIDGVSIGLDNAAPFTADWDTTSGFNGSHTVLSTASDPSGNTASDSVGVTVDNPVLVEWTPVGGAVYDSQAGSHAETYDDDLGTFWRSASTFAFDEVWIYWDLGISTSLSSIGIYQSSPNYYSNSLTIQYSDDAVTWTQLPEGGYTGLTYGSWMAFDFEQQTGRYWRLWDIGNTITYWEIAEVEIWGPSTGDTDVIDPVVSVTAPTGGATVSGAGVAVSADASDDVGVDRVEFFVNGGLVGVDSSGPFSVVWDTTGEADGPGYVVSATVFDTSGNTASDSVTVTVDNTIAPSPIDELATSSSTIDGSVSGAVEDTHADDGVTQAITEEESGGKPSNRVSRVELTWTIDVTGGDVATVYLNAWTSATAEAEEFDFSYSTDGGGTWVEMLTVSATSDDGYQEFVLPPSAIGEVIIRVVDADRTPGNRTLDTLFVDHLFVRSEPVSPGTAPATPSLLAAIDGFGMVSVTWSDNAGDEVGYEVERRLIADVWSVVAVLQADATSYVDANVTAASTYEYRVRAYGAGGLSEYSEIDSATVQATSIALSAFGFKEKGAQNAQLDWSESTLVNILRDGVIVATNVAGSTWIDNIGAKGGGTYVYQACDVTSGGCSNTATVVF